MIATQAWSRRRPTRIVSEPLARKDPGSIAVDRTSVRMLRAARTVYLRPTSRFRISVKTILINRLVTIGI
jgi:hypothetical protein